LTSPVPRPLLTCMFASFPKYKSEEIKHIRQSCHTQGPALMIIRSPPAEAVTSARTCARARSRTSTECRWRRRLCEYLVEFARAEVERLRRGNCMDCGLR
jgi:hypothetical protein